MLTGRIAFEADAPIDIVQKVLSHRPALVSSIRMDIPDVISHIVAKMIHKQMDERYHSVSGLKYDLTQVAKFLGEGDENSLNNYKIGMKDVSSFFILSSKIYGRDAEIEKIHNVIEKTHKRQRSSTSRAAAHALYSISSNSSFSESRTDVVEIIDTSSDSKSLGPRDGRSNSTAGPAHLTSISGAEPPALVGKHSLFTAQGKSVVESRNSSWDTSDRESHVSNTISSHDRQDNYGAVSRRRGSHKPRRRGHSEVVTLLGPQGVGKSHLIKTVQPAIRRHGYFALGRFDRARPTPFEPLLKIMSSLFRQIFSERDVGTAYHELIRTNVSPIWGVLHNLLDLPFGLLNHAVKGAQNGIARTISHRSSNDLLSVDNISSRSSYADSSNAPSNNDFLRGPTSTESIRFMNTYVEVLRVMSAGKLICLCLDDIHTADEESIELVQSIMKSRTSVVLIFSGRQDDGLPDHVTKLLEADRTNQIELSNLHEKHVFEYVAATLSQDVDTVVPLAAVVLEKSAGNPFLMKEILQTCYQKNCLWYDWKSSGWQFDLDRVFDEFTGEEHGCLTTNFITKRLHDMPPAARSILAWASLLGNSFSFFIVQKLLSGEYLYSSGHDQANDVTCPKRAKLFNLSEPDCIDGLQTLLSSCIIVPGETDDEFRFAHGRYLRAANSMRECHNTTKMHFIIAQTMMKYINVCRQTLYDVARHICLSADIIKQRVSNRVRHRDVLWKGGQTAAESGARPTALWYYKVCIDLLQEDKWNGKDPDVFYEETLQLYVQAAEMYHTQGENKVALMLLEETIENARSASEKTRSRILHSKILARQGDFASALSAVQTSLTDMGLVLDATSWDECDIAFKKLEYRIRKIDHDELVSRPLSEDREVIAIGTTISEAMTLTFWTDSFRFYQVSLSRRSSFGPDVALLLQYRSKRRESHCPFWIHHIWQQ